MTYAELVQMYFERSNALQGYWTLYVVVLGGLLGFASMRKQPDVLTTLVVSVLYACFAYKNLGAIVEVSEQRLAVLGQLKALVESGQGVGGTALLGTMRPPAVDGLKHFHFVCDVLTVLALWAMELRRRRAARVGAAM